MDYQLNKRERELLNIFWERDEPLGVSEMTELSKISKNTVAATLRRLLDDGYIKIDQIDFSGKVLARKYTAVITATDLLRQEAPDPVIAKLAKRYIRKCKNLDTLNDLQQKIQKKIENL